MPRCDTMRRFAAFALDLSFYKLIADFFTLKISGKVKQ